MLRLAAVLLPAIAAVAVPGAGRAMAVHAADIFAAGEGGTAGGLVWSSGGRGFATKTVGTPGVTGLGIVGGRTPDEIDMDETLTATSASPVVVSWLDIGMLFDGPEYDDAQEVARVAARDSGGVLHVFALTATGTATATWTGPGTASNLSPADGAGGGAWRLEQPFGSLEIVSISLAAVPGDCGGGRAQTECNQSDFALVGLGLAPAGAGQEVAVAAPGAFGLLAGGLLGLAAGVSARGRRRRR